MLLLLLVVVLLLLLLLLVLVLVGLVRLWRGREDEGGSHGEEKGRDGYVVERTKTTEEGTTESNAGLQHMVCP